MTGDFIKIGDTFIHEGRRFTVLGIPTSRSLDLGDSDATTGSTHRFTVSGSSMIYWDKVADEWVARGGFLSPLVLTVTCGRCRGTKVVLSGYASPFGPTSGDCPECGGQGRIPLEEEE